MAQMTIVNQVSQYIPNKSYTDLINGTSTEILISSMSSDDLYHRIISIEESVDIYIYDGCQRAIIEVKFSLPEKYYAGSTHYSITARTGDGIKQLDKYARHLAKDGRLVDFGYVYMFYMSDVKKETLMSRIDNKTNELLRGLSDELNSIFDGVEMNDMKCWGTAS